MSSKGSAFALGTYLFIPPKVYPKHDSNSEDGLLWELKAQEPLDIWLCLVQVL